MEIIRECRLPTAVLLHTFSLEVPPDLRPYCHRLLFVRRLVLTGRCSHWRGERWRAASAVTRDATMAGSASC